MDNSLENSFVEKVVAKNNLAQAAQIEQAKAASAQSGKPLLTSLKELHLLGDDHVTKIGEMFEKYKQTQGIAAGSTGSSGTMEPAAPAGIQRIGPSGGGSGGSAPTIQRIGPVAGAPSAGVQRIGPVSGGSGGTSAPPTIQKIGPAAGTPPPAVQKIGPAAPTIQKIGPAAGTTPSIPSAQGTPNPILKIRSSASTSNPTAAATSSAPPQSAPPQIAPKIQLTGAGTGHPTVSHAAPPPQVQRASGTPHVQVTQAPPTPRDVAQYSHVHHYLEYARNIGASDLHINTNSPPIIRKYGKLISLPRPPFTNVEAEKLLMSILTKAQRDEIEEKRALDFCYTVEEQGRYRSCILKQRNGWDGSFRVVKSQVPTFEELGLPTDLKRLTEYHQGLVLVTGPNGCGKSTTMAALLNLINQNREEHIISIEDPVEYTFEPMKCQVNQREVGQNTKSFANALRAALREDPDIIMIGELRDEETVGLAITAAETGHLVFGTLHTTSAGRTIDRMLDVFPPDEQGQIRSMISESIKGIICQQLVPRKDGNGRVLAMEILFNTPAVANLIRERKLHQLPSAMQTGRKLGMVLLDDSLMTLVKAGTIEGADAFYSAENKATFAQWAPKAV